MTGGVRVAIAGYGLAGEVFHAPLVAATEGLELVAVTTSNPARAQRARVAYPDIAAHAGRRAAARRATARPARRRDAQPAACPDRARGARAYRLQRADVVTHSAAARLVEETGRRAGNSQDETLGTA